MMPLRWLDRMPATEGLAVLADASLKGLVVLLAASAAAAALRKSSAAVRHLVWTLAVLGVLALPALSAVVPAWRIGLPGLPAGPGEGARAEVLAPAPAPEPDRPLDTYDAALPAPVARSGDTEFVAGVVAAVERIGAAPRMRPAAGMAETPAPTPRRGGWPAAVLLVWTTGALAVLATIALGFVRVRWLARRARSFEAGRCTRLVELLAAGLGLRRRVALLRGDAAAMPMTWGILRPAVLLPAGAERWPEARLRAVLLHELAHIRRRDHLVQLGAELACALYWFNPLVWLTARRLRVEREHACDDQVLAGGAPAAAYAGELLDVARSLRTARATAMAAMALARPSELEGRLLAVLDEGRSRACVSGRLALLAALCAACLLLPLAALRPASAAPRDAASRLEAPRTRDVEATAGLATTSLADAPPEESNPAPGRALDEVTGDASGGALALAATTAAAPAVPDAAGCRDRERARSSSHNVRNGVHTIKWSSGPRCTLEVRIEGEVDFTEDFTGILSISPGGRMRIEETDGAADRRLEVRSGRDGGLAYEWTVDGRRRDFDREGQAWLSSVLLDVFRRTGFAAEKRATWLLKSSGPEGVLGEVARMGSDYAQRIYLQAVVELESVDQATLQRAIRLASQGISSDFELAELLIATAGRHAFTGGTGTAFIEASQTISSDFEQRRVLSAALARGGLGAGEVRALLRAAQEIDSDFELAELLTGVAGSYRFDGAMRDAYLEAAATIGSDFERRRVLSTLLRQGGLSAENLAAVLESAASLGSDFELAELLVQVSGEDLSHAALQKAFLAAASTISSDFEHRRVLATLLAKERLSPEALATVLQSALTIDSDFELAELLVQIARGYRLEGALRQAYLKAADTIGSRHEYGRVAAALLQQERGSGTS